MTYTKSQIREMVEEVLEKRRREVDQEFASIRFSNARDTEIGLLSVLRTRFTDKLNSLED